MSNFSFLSRSIIVISLLSITICSTAQKPKWLKQKLREKEYSKEIYLTGIIFDNKKVNEGVADALERVKVMAKAEIAHNLISEIQADHTIKTTENNEDFSQSFESNILSETKAEIYGMHVEGYFDKGESMVYGFAYAKRDDVVKYYKTNIDKYIQEINALTSVANDLMKKNDLINAQDEFNKTFPYFTKIEFASDFIVLIKSTPLDNSILQKIRTLRYDVENKLDEIEDLKTKALYTIEYNYKKYQVLPEDLNGTYSWINAKKTCDELVAFELNDWILPSKHLLNEMFRHKNEIKKFKPNGAYWSSEEKDNTAWGRQFKENGVSGFGNKAGVARVRCVRKL